MTKYICLEGLDGCGKSSVAQGLKVKLEAENKTVLLTSEPGYRDNATSMKLRELALDPSSKLDKVSRELILQASRSVVYNDVILPAMGKYDYIIQDRGILSSLSYGKACGVDYKFLQFLLFSIYKRKFSDIYTSVILINAPIDQGLLRARNGNKEFKGGDIFEVKDNEFFYKVHKNMHTYKREFSNVFEVENYLVGLDELVSEVHALI